LRYNKNALPVYVARSRANKPEAISYRLRCLESIVKTCVKCKVEKEETQFPKAKDNRDGLRGDCRECNKKYLDTYYKENRDEILVKQGEYYKSNKEAICRKHREKKYWKEARKKYPEKVKARNAVSNAIRDGRLEKKPCIVCGETKAQAHHHKGYDKDNQLDVQWLCRPCHGKEHRKDLP